MKNVKIEDVALICRGASPRPIIDYITKKEDGINWIKIGDVDDDSIYINKTEEKITNEGALKSRFVKKGDFILSNSMSFGRPYILNIDGCVHDGWLILSDYEKFMLQKYFYYVLKSNNTQEQFFKTAQGATVKNLNSDIVRKTSIKIYDFPKQQKIVSTLDKINVIIDADKKQLELLDEIIKSRFIEMFGDLKETIRLGDCCEVHARIGWQSLTTKEHLQNGDYMLITGTDFINNEIDYSTCVYVSKERYDLDKHIILKNDDVLITKDGTIGKVAVVHNLPKPATLNGGVFVVRPDSRFNKEYVSYVFKGPLFEDYVNKVKTGATIKHLNQKFLVEFLIPVPSIKKQIEFANFSKLIDKSKFNVQQHLNLMQELLDKKMNEYFS